MNVKNSEYVQEVFPGEVRDYLGECENELIQGTRIVAFPRDPKPHEVKEGWIVDYWI